MHITSSEETFDLEIRTANEKDLKWVDMLKYFKTYSFGLRDN